MESGYLRNRQAYSSSPVPSLSLRVVATRVRALNSAQVSSGGRIEFGSQHTLHKVVSIMHCKEQNSNQLNFLRLTSPFDYPLEFWLLSLRCVGRRSLWIIRLLLGCVEKQTFVHFSCVCHHYWESTYDS